MAAGYVDDHKLILYRDGAQPRDITAFASDMTLTDELEHAGGRADVYDVYLAVGQVHA